MLIQIVGTYHNLTPSSVTLKTNVYEIKTVLGQTVGWVPRHPSYIKFDFTVLSALNTNIYFQNETLSSSTRTYNATNEILVGKNVTSTKPIGNYLVTGSSNIVLKAGNQITLNKGTTIFPFTGGQFEASVEPFFTCTQYPLGKIINTNSMNNTQENNQYFIKNYDVSYKKTKITKQNKKPIKLKVYPNPATTTTTTIEYYLSMPSEVKISLCDLKGNVLINLKNREIHQSGKYKINLKLADYPPNSYSIKLIVNNQLFNAKLVKL